ncbi:MAG: alanine racemase, partial [Deferribacteraceae bacterium]|nr:alanine racemase [Deferribacteraceae bacterium]
MEYKLTGLENIATPALVFYKEVIKENIALAIKIAASPSRIRSHVKSHKTVEVAKMQMKAGIVKFKTATIAETEMLAMEGFADLMLAYPLVGVNIARFIALVQKYHKTKFSAITDDPAMVETISAVAKAADVTINLLVDVDPGMHRTGIDFSHAAELFRKIDTTPNLHAMGFHVYDGHNHDKDFELRSKNAKVVYDRSIAIKKELEAEGKTIETIVLGGTPSFPCHAQFSNNNGIFEPGVELSPGTCFLQDYSYQNNLPDIPFKPAALLVTRVVSKPNGKLAFDIGYKAVASDPLPDNRAHLIKPVKNQLEPIPFTFVMQNEEHLVLDVPNIKAAVGDLFYAIPTHICPTSALYEEILVA